MDTVHHGPSGASRFARRRSARQRLVPTHLARRPGGRLRHRIARTDWLISRPRRPPTSRRRRSQKSACQSGVQPSERLATQLAAGADHPCQGERLSKKAVSRRKDISGQPDRPERCQIYHAEQRSFLAHGPDVFESRLVFVVAALNRRAGPQMHQMFRLLLAELWGRAWSASTVRSEHIGRRPAAGEGVFLACSFWRTICPARRYSKAHAMFDRLLTQRRRPYG